MKHKKLLVSLVAGILAVVMVLSLVVSLIPTRAHAASSGEIQNQLDDLQGQKDDIQGRMSELEQQKRDNLTEIEDLVAQKNNIDQQVALLNAQIRNINDQISAYNMLIADKQDELDQAEARLADLNEKNKERIQAMEENGFLSYWSVLFKANSFADLLDRLSMMEEIASADKRRLEEMNQVAEQVAKAKEELTTEKAELESAQNELSATELSLETKRQEADTLLNELIGRGEEFQAYMDELQLQESEVANRIAQKEQEYNEAKEREEAAAKPPVISGGDDTGNSGESDGSGESGESGESGGAGDHSGGGNSDGDVVVGGGWIVPVDYVYVSDPYGWRTHPIYGYEIFHSGVDLAAYYGTPIYASRGGEVTTATYDGSCGNYVTVNHGDGFSSSYLHMSDYVVSVGQWVNQGELIGYVGSTGASTGPHLHFSVYKDGSTVDPSDYVYLG